MRSEKSEFLKFVSFDGEWYHYKRFEKHYMNKSRVQLFIFVFAVFN